jgi:hypothetical protein
MSAIARDRLIDGGHFMANQSGLRLPFWLCVAVRAARLPIVMPD